jgi:hypothetical protein
MVKITGFRVRHMAAMRAAAYARKIPALKPRLIERFAADLRDLCDALQHSALDGRYWVWSGLLLGWAREGAILQHDSLDADFAVADEDFQHLVDAIPALLAAGFVRDRCFINNEGVVTELTFLRHGARFDFFRMFQEPGQRRRYFMYSIHWNGILEIEAVVPDQPRVPFSFIERTWLKVKDHELELKSIYGNWQVPDPSWSYLEGLDVVSRTPSRHSHFDWRDDADLPSLPAEANVLPVRNPRP